MNTSKKICLFVLCVLALTAAPATCVATIVTDYKMLWETQKHDKISSCYLNVYILNDDPSSKIFNTVITPASIGSTLVSTINDTGFINFVNHINETDGCVVLDLQNASGVSDTFSMQFANAVVFKGVSELQGPPIDRVSLKINNFELRPIWGGDYTYVSCDFTLFLETPEPLTIASLFLGTLFIPKKRK